MTAFDVSTVNAETNGNVAKRAKSHEEGVQLTAVSDESKSANEKKDHQPIDAADEMRDKIRLHYNSMAMNDSRLQSNIYCLRLLHNWIKSCLIQQCVEFLNLMTKRAPFAVLDLCCGKGGDLLKWSQYPNLEYLAGIDIAETCVQKFQNKFSKFKSQCRINFKCESHVIDLGREKLRKYLVWNKKFHIASCQFSIHYFFESYDQISRFLDNVSQNLYLNGLFVITFPNGPELVRQFRKAGHHTFGNSNYQIRFNSTKTPKCPMKLFGEQLHFKLNEEVDVPEFLVYFPALLQMLENRGFKMLNRATFPDFIVSRLTSTNQGKKCFELLLNTNALPLSMEYQKHKASMRSATDASLEPESEYFEKFKKYLHSQPSYLTKDLENYRTIDKDQFEVSKLYELATFIKIRP